MYWAEHLPVGRGTDKIGHCHPDRPDVGWWRSAVHEWHIKLLAQPRLDARVRQNNGRWEATMQVFNENLAGYGTYWVTEKVVALESVFATVLQHLNRADVLLRLGTPNAGYTLPPRESRE